MTTTPTPTIDDQLRQLEPWFHNLHLPDGRQTAPDHWLGDFPASKWQQIAPAIPEDLTGWSVLDIGCNAGFYAIELAKRGANVLAVDHDEKYLRQARWAAEQFGLDEQIEVRQMDVYDLYQFEESFDLVWFMGVFYHLRYPMLGLDLVCRRVRKLLVFQTLTMPGPDTPDAAPADVDINDREHMLEPAYPKMAFIEHQLAGDPTNWWAANPAGVRAMLRAAGMQVLDCPAHEVYLCEPDDRPLPSFALPRFMHQDHHG